MSHDRNVGLDLTRQEISEMLISDNKSFDKDLLETLDDNVLSVLFKKHILGIEPKTVDEGYYTMSNGEEFIMCKGSNPYTSNRIQGISVTKSRFVEQFMKQKNELNVVEYLTSITFNEPDGYNGTVHVGSRKMVHTTFAEIADTLVKAVNDAKLSYKIPENNLEDSEQ